MFLQASVILLTGGWSASVHVGIPSPQEWRTPQNGDPLNNGESPQKWRPPNNGEPPQEWRTPSPQEWKTPPRSMLQHTVNELPVRILLECILVSVCS